MKLFKLIHNKKQLRTMTCRVGRKMYMLARGDLQNDLNTNGERYIQQCIVDHFEHPVVLDVGANVGDWTASFHSISGRNATVHAFEPVSATYQQLSQNINRLNIESQTITQQIAFSEQAGEIDILVVEDGLGINTLEFDERMKFTAQRLEKVTTTTIDDYASRFGIPRINLLKIDTEGHDLAVLRGAKQLLAESSIDVIQFEYNYRWIYARNYLKDIFDEILTEDYIFGKILPDHVEIYSEWHYEMDRFFEANYVLIKKSNANYFNLFDGGYDNSNCYR